MVNVWALPKAHLMFTWFMKIVGGTFPLEIWESIKIEKNLPFKRKFSSCWDLECLYNVTLDSNWLISQNFSWKLPLDISLNYFERDLVLLILKRVHREPCAINTGFSSVGNGIKSSDLGLLKCSLLILLKPWINLELSVNVKLENHDNT